MPGHPIFFSVLQETEIIEVKKTDLHLERLVRAEKLQLLFNQSFPAIPISFLIAILQSAILWPVQRKSVLLAWLTILAVIAIGRILLFIFYWRAAPEEEKVLVWEKPYFITLTMATITWGVGAVFIMPDDSVLHQVVVYFFLVGLSGGAISVYSAHRTMTLVTLAILLLPTTFWFFMQANLLLTGMAAAGFIFFLSSIRSGKILSNKLNQSFMLAHELKLAKEKAEELALIYNARGIPMANARELASKIMEDPEHALDTLAREELGLNPDDLGSPWGASLSSFTAFAIGAFVPLLPFVVGVGGVAAAAVITLGSLFLVGALLSLFTGRSARRSGLRMVLIGGIAGLVTYIVGGLMGINLL